MRVLSVLCSLTMLVVSAMSLTAQPAGVRLALVNVPDDVLRPLLPTFEQQHKLRASIVYTRNDPFAEVATKARYVSNASAGARYLEDIALAGTAAE